MAHTSEQVLQLIKTGQNVIITSSYLTTDIIKMARGLSVGQTLTIREANKKLSSDLLSIAVAATRGKITFDLT